MNTPKPWKVKEAISRTWKMIKMSITLETNSTSPFVSIKKQISHRQWQSWHNSFFFCFSKLTLCECNHLNCATVTVPKYTVSSTPMNPKWVSTPQETFSHFLFVLTMPQSSELMANIYNKCFSRSLCLSIKTVSWNNPELTSSMLTLMLWLMMIWWYAIQYSKKMLFTSAKCICVLQSALLPTKR